MSWLDWISQNKQWVFSGVGVTAILVIGGFLWRAFRRPALTPPAPTPPATVTNTADATVRDSGNASVTQHFNFPPGYPATPPPVRAQPQRLRPNIVFLVATTFGLDFENGYYETRATHTIGLKACFRNEVTTERTRTAYRMRAHFVFWNAEGTEIGTGISGAVWLNPDGYARNLEVSESGCVLVLVQRTETLELGSPYKLPRATEYGEVFEDEVFEFQELPTVVEVRLIDGQDDVLSRVSLDIAYVDGRLNRATLKRPS
jgi:hypothetical protein